MRFADTEGPLRHVGETLVRVVEQLPRSSHSEEDWGIKCVRNRGSGLAWIRLIGNRTRKYPKQSAHVVVKAHPSLQSDPRFARGKDWWGSHDCHVVVPPGDAAALELAEELITLAHRLDQEEA